MLNNYLRPARYNFKVEKSRNNFSSLRNIFTPCQTKGNAELKTSDSIKQALGCLDGFLYCDALKIFN